MLARHFVLSQKIVGKTRREIANIISQSIGLDVQFTGAPKMAYIVGGWSIDRDGIIKTPITDFIDLNDLQTVYSAIEKAGIFCVGLLTIEISEDELSDTQYTNLRNVLQRKGYLIKKSLDTVAEIVVDDDNRFTWFNSTNRITEIVTYIHLVRKLIDHARILNRASSKIKEVENEKYDFRCFLIRLGFIGDAYKNDRKILLSNLEGNSSYKNSADKHIILQEDCTSDNPQLSTENCDNVDL